MADRSAADRRPITSSVVCKKGDGFGAYASCATQQKRHADASMTTTTWCIDVIPGTAAGHHDTPCLRVGHAVAAGDVPRHCWADAGHRGRRVVPGACHLVSVGW